MDAECLSVEVLDKRAGSLKEMREGTMPFPGEELSRPRTEQ